MHGTVMMFLFAVPAVEAMGILLLPQMLGARDLPFPRLGAFAFWAYLVGGLVFFSTLFFDLAPTGGWFMYPPLTSTRYSPGMGADFWLLGIGFIEISAIAGAIEIIVGVLRTRAPGMTLVRMPMFAWTMLIFAGMIVFAFPGGDPCHHHAGARARVRMAVLHRGEGRRRAALAAPVLVLRPSRGLHHLPAGGRHGLHDRRRPWPARRSSPTISSSSRSSPRASSRFGLWVHHMFTTGIPAMSLSFFSAASMAVAIPSGIQVFAWIATIAAGRLQLATPAALRSRLPVHLHARRPDRRDGGDGAVRLAGARHLLRRRASALRARRRHGLSTVRRHLLLGPRA